MTNHNNANSKNDKTPDGHDTTRQSFANALIHLSEQQPINKMTVVDIAAEAGLSVRTFYNVFADKYDLVGWIYLSRLKRCYQEVEAAGGSYYDFQIGTMREMETIGCFYKNAFTNTHGRDSIREAMRTSSAEFFEEQARRMCPPPSDQFKFTMQFFEMGISGSIINYTMNNSEEPLETIALWITLAIPDDIKYSIAPAGVSREQWLKLPDISPQSV